MLQTAAIIVGIVVVAAVILYISDRRSRGEPIEMGIMAKIASFSAVVASGIIFALQSDAVAEAVSTVSESAQDMFVGKPTF